MKLESLIFHPLVHIDGGIRKMGCLKYYQAVVWSMGGVFALAGVALPQIPNDAKFVLVACALLLFALAGRVVYKTTQELRNKK